MPLLALGACQPDAQGAGGEDEQAAGVRTRELPLVRIAEVEVREMVQVLETTSKLESEREIQIFPELGGIVTEVLVEEGDHLAAGEVMARLDARDETLAARDAEVALKEAMDRLVLAELAVEEAEANIASAARSARQAERDYDRDRRLAEVADVANPLSEQALEAKLLERDDAVHAEEQAKIMHRRMKLEESQAKTAISRAEVALERARLAVSKMEIKARFEGVVAERTVRVGDTVAPGEPLFVLTDTEALRAVFTRPQEELSLFSDLGSSNGTGTLEITATAEALPGETFEGWVERISPTVDPVSNQFRVVARLASGSEGNGRLLPGMLVRMEIVIDRHPDALVLPKRALRREGERRYVLLLEGIEDGEPTCERIDVTEGYEDDDYVELVPSEPGSLVAGSPVIVIGGRDLVDGDAVRIDSSWDAATGTADGGPEALADFDDGAGETPEEPDDGNGDTGSATELDSGDPDGETPSGEGS